MMPSYVAYIFVALVSIFVTTNWFLPLLARYLTRCRLTYLSLSRIKGFEWRHESHASAIVPDIRLEHGSWRYGGWNRPEGVGFIVIYASGLSYRQRDRPRSPPSDKNSSPKSRSPLAEYLAPITGLVGAFAKTLIIGVPSLLIHHYPSLGGLLSFHISDGRFIFDELDGLEVTWSTLKLGAKVSFSRKDEIGLGQDEREATGRSSISSTAADDNEPVWPASPPDSPIVEFHRPFVFPPASEENTDSDTLPRPSRLSHARRQASAMSSRMTSTAAQIWGRVIGRARGHVKLTVEISDLAVILPHSNPAHPLARPSIPDLVPQPHPQCDSNGLSHRLSSKSLKARTVKNTYSMDRLFRSVPRYALPSHEGGYERLLALEGKSTMTGTMRFGTRRGWLSEDTLSLDTELGKLHTSLGAGTKIQALMDKYAKEKKSKAGPGSPDEKARDKEVKKAEERWSGDSKARILLRALQSVSISFSQVVISHFLSVSNSNAGSANSSSSDLSSLASEDFHTVSLDVRALVIKLSAADASNNLRARNAFGTNTNRSSRVKGIAFDLTWDAIDIDSTSPGGYNKDKNQLLAIRQADFEGFSSWRPHGWIRDELLFVNDPNLALVVLTASLGSVNAAADVQLLNELSEAWAATHPRSAPRSELSDETIKSAVQLPQGLPPRLRLVFDIGRCKLALSDRISQQKTTLSIATNGLHMGASTSYADRVGRRKDKMSMRNAFKEEEQLQQRRAEMGDAADYALPDAMLKPQLRRRFHHEHAKLLDDLTMSMSFEGNFEMEPIAVHLSIQEGETGQKQVFSLAEIGRTHGNANGDVLGRQILDLVDTARLDPTTLSGSIGFGIDGGINVNLWEVPVLEALVALGEAHTSTDTSPASAAHLQVDILSRLPSGLSCRFSLGLISVFVGQSDPNPATDSRLVRGIWFQTFAVLEYAYYVNAAQTVRTRHDLIAPIRAKLKLPDDITTQALACYSHHTRTEGRAALCRLNIREAFITPIFDGRKFDQAGGTRMNFQTWQWPEAPIQEDDYTAWEFIKPRKSTKIDGALLDGAGHANKRQTDHKPRRRGWNKNLPYVPPQPSEEEVSSWPTVPEKTKDEDPDDEDPNITMLAGWGALLEGANASSLDDLRGTWSSFKEGDDYDDNGRYVIDDKVPRPDYKGKPAQDMDPGPEAVAAEIEKARKLRNGEIDDEKVEDGAFSNAIPLFDESGTNRARRPLVRISRASINWTIQRKSPDAELEHRLTGTCDPIAFVCGMPLFYCAILAGFAVKRVADAWKRPAQEGEVSRKRSLVYIDYTIPSITAHIAFPLKEHMFVHFGSMHISHEENRQMRFNMDQALFYVPSTSPREKGQWHEFGLVKRFSVTKDSMDSTSPSHVDMEAFRIRVPVGYQISNLVLNITSSIKGLKLIMENLKSGEFASRKSPAAEAPKDVPPLVISIKEVSLEAKDSPIEERLNLIWRVGMAEQVRRLDIEDTFKRKAEAIEEYERLLKKGEIAPDEVDDDEISPWHFRNEQNGKDWMATLWSERWVARIDAALAEQKRRERLASNRLHTAARELKLPITIAPPALSAPLFRASFQNFQLSIKNPGMTRNEIIAYMGDVSASPFDDGAQFSLMVPLHLNWDMGSARVSLRDYPLPLINIRPRDDGRPAWTLDTTFIIAEELHDDDSTMYVPCEIIPAGLGDSDASAFVVEVFKTISPVKTYTRPHIKIHSTRTTEFTWGNSMQPAIQDFMKVMETLSHAQIDPSPRIGFWDKFRLILHWVVKVDFEGPVHLHLKGSSDPYLVDGKGAGFALAWDKNTRLRIAAPNEQYETVQISAEELLIAIPDLDALNDRAALGTEQIIDPDQANKQEHTLISRRYTKPCARFMNGVRVGFGFALERTCRSHSCKDESCDSSAKSLMHRKCRITDFKRHQDVILRNKQAVQRDKERLGRSVDSYDGFRSDYVHFSVSVTCPLREIDPDHPTDSTSHNSLHLSPKAFAHFFSWWRLFNHVMSLPIRQGRLFPDSPEPSKKFGDSLATIKFRCDLKPVYVSHMYGQKSRELWDQGRTQSLGIKARFGHFRADCHMRKQEKQEHHKKLKRDKVITHKAFCAADLILEDIEVKGIRAEFHELPKHLARRPSDESSIASDESNSEDGSIKYVKASYLGPDEKAWFNLYDFIDADKRPFDHDPKIELLDIADCPEVFYSLRNKVRTTPLQKDEESELEMSKFGDEKTHICYLGESKSVAKVQIKIIRRRIRELQDKVKNLQLDPMAPKADINVYKQRLQVLHDHIKTMQTGEKRDIDSDTFEHGTDLSDEDPQTGEPFHNVVHVHCPSIYLTNQSRNLAYQYWYSYRDRKQEEYHTSNESLVTVRASIKKRKDRAAKEAAGKSKKTEEGLDDAHDLLAELKQAVGSRNAPDYFRLPVDHEVDHVDLRQPSNGLPAECKAQPRFRVLLLKPQIIFRSEADPDAIILLAVEEYSHKTFKVIDTTAKDDVTKAVLHRTYGSLKGLQAFYPNAETLARDRDVSGPSRGVRRVPALPLEIFLDVRSEAKDYDRIILKTDAAISQDKFNKLRVTRNLTWPDARDEQGESIKHLKSHMDQMTIVVPRIALAATSKHYSALYCIITDLLLYQDPDHRQRSDLIDTFMLQFDRKDRDPESLFADIDKRQREIRYLREIVRGYDQHLDLLTDAGKSELFARRAHLFEATEELFCVFELLSANFDREDARAAAMNAVQTNIRAGSIAWNLLQDDMKSLVKLDIDGTMLSVLRGKDESMDSACVVSDLSALNSKPDALFPEVAVRYETGNSIGRIREPMASVVWSSSSRVGGIQIVRLLSVKIHPLRLQLEERVGRQIKDYIFNDRVSRRRHAAGDSTPRNDSSLQVGSKHSSTLELAPLNRSKSAVSVNSSAPSTRSVSTAGRVGDQFDLVGKGDADEMRKRASSTRTFGRLELASTTFVVTYKRDEKRKHKAWSMPAAVDLKIKTPNFAYHDKIWSIEDAFKQMQRDGISNMLLSTGLIGQVVRKTGVFRSNKSLKSLAKHTSPSARPSGGFLGNPSSRLKFAVEGSNGNEDDSTLTLSKSPTRDGALVHGHGVLGSPIQRVVSRLSQSGHLSSPSSPSSAERSSSSHLSKSPSTSMFARSREHEPADSMPSDEAGNSSEEDQHEGGSVGRAVKGLIDKFKNRKDSPEVSSRRGSYDDVSHSGYIGRLG